MACKSEDVSVTLRDVLKRSVVESNSQTNLAGENFTQQKRLAKR